MKKEKEEKRIKVIRNSIIVIVFLIGAILGCIFFYNLTWPDTYTETEVTHYKTIAERAWNEGIAKIKDQDVCSSNLSTDSYISFEYIDKNKISIESVKKGSLIFDFSDSKVTTEYIKAIPTFMYIIILVLLIIVSCLLGVCAVFILLIFLLILDTILEKLKH